MTTHASPRRTSAMRTPCSAMAPTVTKAASAESTPSGIARRQAHRHADDFGVIGLARARARNAVADREAFDAVADVEDGARAAVAERHGDVDARSDGLDGGRDAVAARLVDDLAHQVGPLAGGVEQPEVAARLGQHALGARADQRPARCGPAGRRRGTTGAGTSTTRVWPERRN